MKSVRLAVLSALFLVIAFSFALPEPALAGPLDGPLVPTCSASQNGGFIGACQLCDLVSLARNLINFSIAFSVIAATLLFAYAGFMYYTAASSPENIKKAHGIFTKTLGGIVLILAAWLVVDILMQTITGGTWALSRDIQCMTYPRGASLPPTPVRTGAGATTVPRENCRVPTSASNPCHASNLSCFGDNAEEASQICMLESNGGNVSARSGSDLLIGSDDGRIGECLRTNNCRSYSVGLWQVNLTVHPVGNLQCPSAFARACSPAAGTLGQARIGNCNSYVTASGLATYNQCVAAAQNPQTSNQMACRLYSESGFQPWTTSAQRCLGRAR